MSAIRVERFGPATLADFYRLHSDANDAGWCRCVAWWVPTWDGWGERTDAENRALREELCARGEWDGYLAYNGDDPVAWCQVGPRDRLEKLAVQLSRDPDPGAWAVSCVLVAPSFRGNGIARMLVEDVVADLRARGIERLEAYPRAGRTDERGGWTGPEGLYQALGFELVREGSPRSVVALDLTS
jgi:GNAT superfamily N-acetyltransferase